MDWWLASFFLGAILSLFLPIVPEFFALFSLLLLSIIFSQIKALRLTAGLLFGASWMLFYALNFQTTWQNNQLDKLSLARHAQFVEGKVINLQAQQTVQHNTNISKSLIASTRFTIEISKLNNNVLSKPMKMRLNWKKPSFVLGQGQLVALKVKFKPAHGLANLGGFNYKTWLNSKEILATGYVVTSKQNAVIEHSISFRQQLFNRYRKLLPKHQLSPLLLALGFGSRTQLNTNDNKGLRQVLQSTSTGHLIAISGLHIGLVASGSYLLVTLFIRLFPLKQKTYLPCLLTINTRYIAIVFSLIAALAYGYLAGFALPTVRALIMLSLYWLAKILAINISIKRWLFFTLFLITLTSPFSLFTASFWLSVYAVTIIFITLWRFKSLLSRGNKLWRFIKGLLIIQLSLTLMLLPISALFFQQISLVSILANTLAVPWMSFVVIPLCLCSVLLSFFSEQMAQIFISYTLGTLDWLWQYLSLIADKPWAVLKLSNFQQQVLFPIGLVFAILIFLLSNIHAYVNFSLKKLFVTFALLTLLPLTIASANLFFNGAAKEETLNWQLVVFDVGQGLSVLIQNKQSAILYDTGAAYPSGFNMVDAVILPYLQHQGITFLDKVIISHSDNDHAGGLARLKSKIAIGEIIFNNSHQGDNKFCQQSNKFNWHGLAFDMLWPRKRLAQNNDDSCVLLISSAAHQVLITGDISKQVEQEIIKAYPQLTADILLVPHHGSKTSSSTSFIAQIDPQVAIVSAGFLNRWRMPVKDVVNEYKEAEIKLINTAESGQIIVDFSQHDFMVKNFREDLWPFWFAK